MSIRAHKRRHMLATSLSILAMVLQVSTIMLFGQGQPLSQTRDAQTGLLTMVICSPGGLRQITVDASGEIVDEQIPADSKIDCPFAAALAANNLLSPSQTAIIAPTSASLDVPGFHPSQKRLAVLSFLAIPARSPPFALAV